MYSKYRFNQCRSDVTVISKKQVNISIYFMQFLVMFALLIAIKHQIVVDNHMKISIKSFDLFSMSTYNDIKYLLSIACRPRTFVSLTYFFYNFLDIGGDYMPITNH